MRTFHHARDQSRLLVTGFTWKEALYHALTPFPGTRHGESLTVGVIKSCEGAHLSFFLVTSQPWIGSCSVT